MKIVASVIKEYKAWNKHLEINVQFIKTISDAVMQHLPNYSTVKVVELSVLCTSNDRMQLLNDEFRSKNKPTNVLSFPDTYINPKSALAFAPSEDYIYLGDIAFGLEIITQEALEQSKSFQDHFTHLLIHGILHLLGFDHDDTEDAHTMQHLEIEILRAMSIASPY